MMCSTLSMSTANWIVDSAFRSECTTTLATLRCTNTSPGSSPVIWLAGTRLSLQPIHMNLGFCCCVRPLKNPGRARSISAAQARLCLKRSLMVVMAELSPRLPGGGDVVAIARIHHAVDDAAVLERALRHPPLEHVAARAGHALRAVVPREDGRVQARELGIAGERPVRHQPQRFGHEAPAPVVPAEPVAGLRVAAQPALVAAHAD